jgi:hypothetical protein
MDFPVLYKQLLDKLLEHQKDYGEFGLFRNDNVANTVRNYHKEEKLKEKPQVFTTMLAIEQMFRDDHLRHKQRIQSALNWLHTQTETGYFISQTLIYEPIDSFASNENKNTLVKSTAKVYRHTSEALVSFVNFEGLSYRTITILKNILNAQNRDGGWSNTDLVEESKLLSTVFSIQALSRIDKENLKHFYREGELEDFVLSLDQSILNGIHWLVNKNKEGKGFWYTPDVSEVNKFFYTGIILSRLPEILLKSSPGLVYQTISALINNSKDFAWEKGGMIDIDGTARILSALIKVRNLGGNEVTDEFIFNARTKIAHQLTDLDYIDPATLGYLVEVFYPGELIGISKPRKNINKKIVFLAADPSDQTRLMLGREIREIQEKLRMAMLRDKFELFEHFSVRIFDISQTLLDTRPQIVHFSGHGNSDGYLVFESENGYSHFVSPEALGDLFMNFFDEVECVILNACYSDDQARAIAKYIKFVIGIPNLIQDDMAIAFSIGFYQALGAGKDYLESFKLGVSQMKLFGLSENFMPIIITKEE